jgi:diguanylate cyclase (GGDEF)-like protein
MDKVLSVNEFQAEYAKRKEQSEEAGSAYLQQMSRKKGKDYAQIRQCALFEEALALFYLAHYEEGETLLKSFVFDYPKYPFDPFYIDSFTVLSLIQLQKKRFHLAIFYAQQSLSLAEEKRCTDRFSAIYSNLAAPYHELQENERCLSYLDQALRYVDFSHDPLSKMSILYNRSEILLSLGRYEESRAMIEAVEAEAKKQDAPDFVLLLLPLCKAEIALALHEDVDLHEKALAFLHAPFQDNPALMSYILDDDEALFTLLHEQKLNEDAQLYLDKIKAIQTLVPSLMTSIFIAKASIALAESRGEEKAEQAALKELSRLYEKQNEEYAADFEEITRLHFDFVRVTNAYQKAQKRARRLLEESDTDALTLLPNRRSLEKEKKRFSSLAKKAPYFVLALLDYDHFKDINDTYGYQAGDAALRLGGELFKKYASATFKPFRYGGDEFFFAFASASKEEADALLKKIQEGLAQIELKTGDGTKIPLSCCIGYGLFPGTYESFASAFREVSEAVHSAKKSGKGNRVAIVR